MLRLPSSLGKQRMSAIDSGPRTDPSPQTALPRRRRVPRHAAGLLSAALVAAAAPAHRDAGGPFDLLLFRTPVAPHATATARLIYPHSPFGLAVTTDGRATYNIQITATGLPAPASLGKFTIYTAWAALPDLSHWARLGTVTNGTSLVGPVDLNKFLLVISAEPSAATMSQTGPTVLHGTSPSGYLQTFLGHGLYRLPQ